MSCQLQQDADSLDHNGVEELCVSSWVCRAHSASKEHLDLGLPPGDCLGVHEVWPVGGSRPQLRNAHMPLLTICKPLPNLETILPLARHAEHGAL